MIFSSALAKFNTILKLKGTSESDQLTKTLDINDNDWNKGIA